ncbi:MAG TPA: sulfurtransferase [Baekduia sp.]|nr:sulfurtransferase [Baekduia sp.]
MIAPFVGPEWLAAHRDEVVLADVRFFLDGRPARPAYEERHLPGAVHVELVPWLAAEASPQAGRHPLPDPEVFAEGMAQAGIGDATTVVAYDDAGGVIAARLAWLLRITGHDAAVLDGGLHAWTGAVETGPPPAPARARFTARAWPAQRLASIDDVAGGTGVVLDARQAERYAGEPDGVDPRAGHVPGARSLPVREHLGPDGRLLGEEALRARFAAVGVRPGAEVVSMCGSGVTACHNLLVLEHLALGPGRLYAGSWSQYAATDRPAATGPDPGSAPDASDPSG